MLDDFLKEEKEKEISDSTSSFQETTDATSSFLDDVAEEPKLELSPEPETGFLGMTPIQRFIISFMFFLMVLIIGAFFLLVTGVIALPIG